MWITLLSELDFILWILKADDRAVPWIGCPAATIQASKQAKARQQTTAQEQLFYLLNKICSSGWLLNQ